MFTVGSAHSQQVRGLHSHREEGSRTSPRLHALPTCFRPGMLLSGSFHFSQVYRARKKPAVDRLCVGIPPGEVRQLVGQVHGSWLWLGLKGQAALVRGARGLEAG